MLAIRLHPQLINILVLSESAAIRHWAVDFAAASWPFIENCQSILRHSHLIHVAFAVRDSFFARRRSHRDKLVDMTVGVPLDCFQGALQFRDDTRKRQKPVLSRERVLSIALFNRLPTLDSSFLAPTVARSCDLIAFGRFPGHRRSYPEACRPNRRPLS